MHFFIVYKGEKGMLVVTPRTTFTFGSKV